MKNRCFAIATSMVLAGLFATASLPAMADNITIGGCNSCGVAGPFGTVTLTQSGSNVTVVIQANSGFSWKTSDSADIFFNPSSGVTLTANSFKDANGTVGAVSSNNPSLNGLNFGINNNANVDGLGTFGFILTQVGQGQVGNVASVGSWDFTILGVTVAQLENPNSDGNEWGVHVCDAGPQSCSTNTFFAAQTNTIPDGGMTLIMLGGGLVGLATLRRRFGA